MPWRHGISALSAAASDVMKLTPRQDELLKNYKSTGKTVSSPKPRVPGANTNDVASEASAAGHKKLEPVDTKNVKKSAAPVKTKRNNERKRAKMIRSLPNNYMTQSDPGEGKLSLRLARVDGHVVAMPAHTLSTATPTAAMASTAPKCGVPGRRRPTFLGAGDPTNALLVHMKMTRQPVDDMVLLSSLAARRQSGANLNNLLHTQQHSDQNPELSQNECSLPTLAGYGLPEKKATEKYQAYKKNKTIRLRKLKAMKVSLPGLTQSCPESMLCRSKSLSPCSMKIDDVGSPGQRVLNSARESWAQAKYQRRMRQDTDIATARDDNKADNESRLATVPLVSREHAKTEFETALGIRMASFEDELSRSMNSAITKHLKRLKHTLNDTQRQHQTSDKENKHSVKLADVAVLATATEQINALMHWYNTSITGSTKALTAEICTANASQVAQVWQLQKRHVAQAMEEDPALLAEIFSLIDTDQSGTLDQHEIRIALESMGITLSHTELSTAMEEMDADGNDTVDLEEFQKWFGRLRADEAAGATHVSSWRSGLIALREKVRTEQAVRKQRKLVTMRARAEVEISQLAAQLEDAIKKRKIAEDTKLTSEEHWTNERISRSTQDEIDQTILRKLRHEFSGQERKLGELELELVVTRERISQLSAHIEQLTFSHHICEQANLEKQKERSLSWLQRSSMESSSAPSQAVLRRRRKAVVMATIRGAAELDNDTSTGEDQDRFEDSATEAKLQNIMSRLGVGRQYARRLLSDADGHAGLAIVTGEPIIAAHDPHGVAHLFAKLDEDGSGTLERKEVAEMAVALGQPLSSNELDAAMSTMDTDGNGSIDLEELTEWYVAMKKSGRMPSWATGFVRTHAKVRAEQRMAKHAGTSISAGMARNQQSVMATRRR